MSFQRSGISTIVAGAAATVVVVILFAVYVIAAMPPKSSISTSTTATSVTSDSTIATTSVSALTSTSASTSVITSSTRAAGGPLITYSADAYSAEVTSLLNGFATSTGAQVAPVKAGGSFADANQIAAGAPDDVFVSVALTATSSQYLKNLTSNWAVGFASDQMVLAYSNATQSTAAASIISLANTASQSNSTSDWNAFFTSLTSGNVKIGISSPVSDPAGLRGWLVLEAAGHQYGGDQQAYVSPLLQSKGNLTGTNAAALVAPLQGGQIQFLFIYKSAAISDGLRYIALDSHVNLGSPSLSSFYSNFSYTDSAGKTSGAPIILSITVPLSAINTAEALQFVQYVVQNAKGLSSFGLQPFATAMLYNNVPPPASIQALVSQGVIAEAGALP